MELPGAECKELLYTDCLATGGFSLAKPSCYGTEASDWGGPLECKCKVICSSDTSDTTKQTLLKSEKEPKCCNKVTSVRNDAGGEVSFKCNPWCRGDDKRDASFKKANELDHDAGAHAKVIAGGNGTATTPAPTVTAAP